jgi:hypothetical protein
MFPFFVEKFGYKFRHVKSGLKSKTQITKSLIEYDSPNLMQTSARSNKIPVDPAYSPTRLKEGYESSNVWHLTQYLLAFLLLLFLLDFFSACSIA